MMNIKCNFAEELKSKILRKKLLLFVGIIFIALLINGVGNHFVVEQQVAAVYPASLAVVYPKGTDPLDAILAELVMCESSNNDKAVNTKELHGASWGKYQYRIDTWNWALKRYELGNLDILNGEHQDIVTRKMLKDGLWQHWRKCLSDYQ